MDLGDMVDHFRQGPRPVVASMYYDAADLLEEIRQGLVLLCFVEAELYVVLYAVQVAPDSRPGGVLRFSGRCRLELQEWQCRVELNSDTLSGTAQLIK